MDFKRKNGANHKTVAWGTLQEKKKISERKMSASMTPTRSTIDKCTDVQTDELMHVCDYIEYRVHIFNYIQCAYIYRCIHIVCTLQKKKY